MSSKAHFGFELFRFLRELRENNNKEWFKVNKKRYESDVRDPCLNFVSDFGPYLAKVSKHFVADPRPIGGSLFRIYRDTRFSKDKSPYKTHAGIHFRHALGKQVHAPGFYLHLEPGEVFAASGVWRPESSSLAKIREAMVANPEEWISIVTDKEMLSVCEIVGDKLKKAPRGYDPDHPLVEDLKWKDLLTMTHFTEAEAVEGGFIDKVFQAFGAPERYMKFITTALELPW